MSFQNHNLAQKINAQAKFSSHSVLTHKLIKKLFKHIFTKCLSKYFSQHIISLAVWAQHTHLLNFGLKQKYLFTKARLCSKQIRREEDG